MSSIFAKLYKRYLKWKKHGVVKTVLPIFPCWGDFEKNWPKESWENLRLILPFTALTSRKLEKHAWSEVVWAKYAREPSGPHAHNAHKGWRMVFASIREHASTAIFLRARAEKKFALRARGGLESTTPEQWALLIFSACNNPYGNSFL